MRYKHSSFLCILLIIFIMAVASSCSKAPANTATDQENDSQAAASTEGMGEQGFDDGNTVDLMHKLDDEIIEFVNSKDFLEKDLPERIEAMDTFLKGKEGKEILPGSILYKSGSFYFTYNTKDEIPGEVVIEDKPDNIK